MVRDGGAILQGAVRAAAGTLQRPAGERLLGRAQSRKVIEEAIAGAADRLVVRVLAGDSGMGKTTLLEHAAARAHSRGCRVLSAKPVAKEVDLPYVVLADLLADVDDDDLDALPGSHRGVLDAAVLQPAADDTAILAIVHALRTLLEQLSTPRGVLVVVDDLEWVDPFSARVLALCLRRLDEVPLGFLGAVRTGAALPDDVQSLWDDHPERRHDVSPLEPQAIAALIRARCGLAVSQATLEHLWLLCRGNPRVAVEIAEEMLATGPLPRPDRVPLPPALRSAAVGRLDALPVRTRRILQAAAALRQPTVRTAARVARCDPADLALAEGEGIVEIREDRIRFTEPLFTSAAYCDGDPRETRLLHARIAGVVTDPEERLWQLAHGLTKPDERIATALEGAAGRLRQRGIPDAAAQLATHAVRLTPAGGLAIVRRQRVAAAHHLAAGDELIALPLLERAVARARPGDERAEALAELARTEAYGASPRRATVLLHLALSEAAGAGSRSVIHRDLAWASAILGDTRSAREHAGAAIALAIDAEDGLAVCTGLAARAFVDVLAGVAPEARPLERALGLERTMHSERLASVPILCRPTLVAGLVDVRTGHPVRARAALQHLEQELSLKGDVRSLVAVRTVMGELEEAAGSWLQAERYATDALEAPSGATLRPWALAIRARLQVNGGDATAARETAAAGIEAAQAADSVPLETPNRAALALAALVHGDPATARDEITTHMPPAADDPAFAPWVPTRIEALVQLGQLADAETLLDAFAERADAFDRYQAVYAAGRCRGLLLAARGQYAEAAASVRDTVAGHHWSVLPLEGARTQLVLGQLLRRANQRVAARAELTAALGDLERLGAWHWAEEARRELGDLDQQAGFTAAEQRVVDLVLKGRTTPEIAAQLFVSTRTVESHLSSAYRKAGVRGRVELVARLSTRNGWARDVTDGPVLSD